MKRVISAIMLFVLLMCTVGCTNTPKAGIQPYGDKTCYTITMTGEERESYFSTADPVNKIAVTHYGKTGTTLK